MSNLALLTVPKNDEDRQLAVSHPHKNNCLISTLLTREGVGVFNMGRTMVGVVREDYT